ncbi:MAG: enoyl-CoA hydratase/isomerase family protein [Chloroflexota bacterium]|nr:enoyl-CoA hydratase/isomerase family protein [Chloroflexota bacterium]MDE2941796.1 enoyl-CoA hydratase/isomerase family protein [Chloroflexota bacterium]MDE3267616.1 enoyl-CoA hydratase/isomerase family protein [Chloroflexota bacterium]
MTSPFQTITLGVKNGVAEIALNRPRVLNAHNMQMRDDLYEALEAVRDDPDVNSVLLRGEGERAFCTGADLTEFGTAPSRVIARQVRWERDLWGLFLDIDRPIVAALHGFVIGSGVEMALLCDLRIASEDAVFGMPEAALGLIPAAGGTQTLPRALGAPRALQALLGGERIPASRAVAMGLAHRVVPRDRLLEEARGQARRLAELPTQAVRAVKRALRRGMEMPLERALETELRLAASVTSMNR